MLDDIETFIRQLCEAASRETMPRFRAHLDVENKDDNGFDPVTLADKAAEQAIRALILQRFPDHGIVGEEGGALNPDAEYCWHIDPIDGTRAFLCGLPSWGTLVGLSKGGEPIAGVMHQPFTDEFFLGRDAESFHIRGGARARLATSRTSQLSDAKLMTTTPFLFASDEIGRYRTLESRARLARYGFDCYAYAMLAAGHIDLVVESGLNAYDIRPLIPIIENAGGRVTTWQGESAVNGGNILAAANPALRDAALEILSRD